MPKKDTDKAKIELLYSRLLEENIMDFEDATVIEQQQEIAERLGVDPSSIAVKKDILATKLAREGVIMSLHIGRTRFEKYMAAEDIGIKTEDPEFREFLANYVMMGRKRLIPASYTGRLSCLESKARRLLESYSFKTCYGFFVPYTGYDVLKEKLSEIRKDYFAVQEEILDRYYAIRYSTMEDYRIASVEIYKTLTKDPDAYPDTEWQEGFIDKIMELFPSQDLIAQSFYFDINLSFVPITSTVEEQQIRNTLIKEKSNLVREHLNLEHEKLTEKARAEIEKERTKIMREQYKQDRIEEINREVLESYQQQMDGFLGSMVGQLRSMVYEACVTISDSVEKNGHLVGACVKRITNLIDRLKALNFMNDEEITGQINELELIINTKAENRHEGQIIRVLDEIAAANRATLNMLGIKPRTKRSIESMEVKFDMPAPSRRRRESSSMGQQTLPGMEISERRNRRLDVAAS